MRERSSPSRRQARARIDGFPRTWPAISSPCLRATWLSGKPSETPYRRRPPATCRSRPRERRFERWQPDTEHVVETGDILTGDPVAPCCRPHRLEQTDLGGSRTSCSAEPSPPGTPVLSPRTQRPHRPCPCCVKTRPTFAAQVAAFALGGTRQRRGREARCRDWYWCRLPGAWRGPPRECAARQTGRDR